MGGSLSLPPPDSRFFYDSIHFKGAYSSFPGNHGCIYIRKTTGRMVSKKKKNSAWIGAGLWTENNSLVFFLVLGSWRIAVIMTNMLWRVRTPGPSRWVRGPSVRGWFRNRRDKLMAAWLSFLNSCALPLLRAKIWYTKKIQQYKINRKDIPTQPPTWAISYQKSRWRVLPPKEVFIAPIAITKSAAANTKKGWVAELSAKRSYTRPRMRTGCSWTRKLNQVAESTVHTPLFYLRLAGARPSFEEKEKKIDFLVISNTTGSNLEWPRQNWLQKKN